MEETYVILRIKFLQLSSLLVPLNFDMMLLEILSKVPHFEIDRLYMREMLG